MDLHIDSRVVLDTQHEYKSLYSWSLQELDVNGSKVGRDWIPWDWRLYFTARKLTLVDAITIQQDRSDKDTVDDSARQRISAELFPGDPRVPEFQHPREPSYSMFGANRQISSFELQVTTLDEGETAERCTVWGTVHNTYEIDFRNHTQPDYLLFTLYVRPQTFERYVRMLVAGAIDKAVLCVKGVSGFYSDWSPSISTDKIKVLTGHDEHKVEIRDDCKIVPPRLGEVQEANLNFLKITDLQRSPTEKAEEENITPDDSSQRNSPASNVDSVPSIQRSNDARMIALLSSLRTAAWSIVAVLVLILIAVR